MHHHITTQWQFPPHPPHIPPSPPPSTPPISNLHFPSSLISEGRFWCHSRFVESAATIFCSQRERATNAKLNTIISECDPTAQQESEPSQRSAWVGRNFLTTVHSAQWLCTHCSTATTKNYNNKKDNITADKTDVHAEVAGIVARFPA